MGTAFFIQDGLDGKNPEIQLINGRVNVSHNKTGQSITLESNQRLVVDKAQVLIKYARLKTVEFDWYYKGLKFENTPMSEVVVQIASRYGIQIILNEVLRKCAFSGQFSDQPVEIILASISEVYGSDLIKTEGVFEISNGSCK